MEQELRVIVSGGGTGGHIFPAVSIANAIKSKCPNAKILFVGALGRMEMQRVPDAGYEIVGLPVRGFIRPLWSPRNIGVALDFLRSKRMVRKTIREFAPDVVVGVGGYASAATLDAASSMGIPTLIQEQNSYAGVTNKHLADKSAQDMRGIRRHGALLPRREDNKHRQPRAPEPHRDHHLARRRPAQLRSRPR